MAKSTTNTKQIQQQKLSSFLHEAESILRDIAKSLLFPGTFPNEPASNQPRSIPWQVAQQKSHAIRR